MFVAGEGRNINSLTLVLDGNNPRFPWKLSTTMLTYRLTGTTDQTLSDRGERRAFLIRRSRPCPERAPTAPDDESSRTTVRRR